MEDITEKLTCETIHNLKWQPFIGDNYCINSEENRMLIIGESHYSHDTEVSKSTVNDINFTRDMIQENAIEGEDWKIKIIPNFHKAMFGCDSFDTDKFWNLVSFYNFIQRPMLTRGERPNDQDFSDGWKTFFDLIKVIKPKTCLFIGVLASNHLMSSIHDSDFICEGIVTGEIINSVSSRKATLLDSENNEINILFIRHSSAYFSWNSWNEYLKNEIGNQLSWFEKNIGIAEIKNTKEKLNEVYKAIDTRQFESIVDNIKYSPPTKSGENSDFFTFLFELNKYSFAYEIDIDIENLSLISYYYSNEAKNEPTIRILEENGIKHLEPKTFESSRTIREITSEITEEILKIISILKKETK